MLDLQAEQHDQGQSYPDLYEAVLHMKRRHDLHPCAVRPRDGLALRRDSEREAVQDLVKRYRELPVEQQRRLPALLNSLAQLEVVVGDLEASQHDFQEVARLVSDPIAQAEAHHNVYRAALERRDWNEALAALRRCVVLDGDAFEPFPFVRYEPERILGAGGFGVSFLCRERSGGRLVVIKALRADSLEHDVAALFHEMHTLQDLDHPSLVRIYDCACTGGEATRPYLVLEYFEGQTLADYVAQHGPLPPEDWLQIAWPIARALQAVHGRGILHRSLRPAAVLLSHPPPPPSPTRGEGEGSVPSPLVGEGGGGGEAIPLARQIAGYGTGAQACLDPRQRQQSRCTLADHAGPQCRAHHRLRSRGGGGPAQGTSVDRAALRYLRFRQAVCLRPDWPG